MLWFPTHRVFQHDIYKAINLEVFKPGRRLISTCRALSSVFIGKWSPVRLDMVWSGLVWSRLCFFSRSWQMAAPTAVGGGSGRRTVNMLEAKTHLSRLVEAIETGAATEVVIARNGRPVARLTALPGPDRPRRLGVARGQFTVPESIDAANPLIAELFEQA